MFEDEHGVWVLKRRQQHAAGVLERRRGDDAQPRNVCIPALEAVGMLGCELASGTGGHADHDRHVQLPARHMAQRRRIVHDLVEGEQAEIHRHHLDDWPHAVQRRTDARAHEGGFGERGVADALLAELLQQALAHRIAAAVAPDVLAHQEDPLIAQKCLAQTADATPPDR